MTHGSYVNSDPEQCSIRIHQLNCVRFDYDYIKLTRVNKTKYLGIIIDENLKFLEQINYQISRLRYHIFIFYRMRQILSTNQLLILYYALFWPRATYDIIVWGGTPDTTLKSLHILQKKI